MEHMPRWYRESKRLLREGHHHAAYRVLVAAGKRGSLEAAVTFARAMWVHDPSEHCVVILEEVERRVSEKDWRTHFAVHVAYSIGVGADARDWQELQHRAFQHLKAAAKASGDSRMYLSVGLHYWHGLNMVSRDEQRARSWLEAAASSGEAEAVSTYKRFLRNVPTAASAA